MVRAERIRDHCKASATWQDHEMAAEYMVYPALLDVSFQAMFVALTSPATTGALWTRYLPSSIERITVDPSVCHDYNSPTVTADIEAFVTEWSSSSFAGDVTILDATGTRSSIQVEGLRMKAIAEATAANDRLLFAKTTWDVDITHSVCVPASTQDTAAELALLSAIERTAAFYLRSLLAAVPASEIRTFSPPHRHLFAAASTALSRIDNNHNPTVPPSTIHDTPATIASLHAAYPTQADMRLMHAVHTALLPSIRATNTTSLLEAMLASSHLTHFYQHSWGTATLNASIARILQQITHAHPATHILELGAGTGGTTAAILAATSAFSSYTYTDVSAGFFSAAAARFRDPRIAFRVLDIERDPSAQGFAAGRYDVVVAANVLHATTSLAGTLAHARKLLRPGGWLVLLEITAPTLKHLLLDRPLFEEAVTDEMLEKLQKLFGNAKAVLWAIGGEPESKMTVGIGRALRAEMPHLTLQFLEARRRSDLTAKVVVECFLRLVLAADPAVAEHDMLWTVEPEVVVDGGALLLPRLVPDTVINDRFNAERRQVVKTVSTRETCVEMATLDSGTFQCLRETAQPAGAVVDVHYSTTLSKDCTITLGLVRATVPLEEALTNAISHPLKEGTLINIRELTGASDVNASYPNVVHWDSPSLRVAVQPLNPAGLFKPDKTYLTGEIGRTLTTFMLANGACHIALASRNATTAFNPTAWPSAPGATVRPFTMDVTSPSSVDAAHTTILATMPPIAGIANGAMVLHDTLFTALNTPTLSAVLAPKVTGTRTLASAFPPASLDFFVLFSSLASVVGNPGQAAYHAANLAMSSIAAQLRRESGVPAAVMHVGMVADVGKENG
ncbi:putative polyketide synthase [Diplodia seriata]|uniref:Putative polyketide synthase n=1 Tax=Diplodia seriata TaxID=420778 RepID=A0A0G2FNJ2_9PEZI|nr:putative polyketide synthase [Diplodia seriata]